MAYVSKAELIEQAKSLGATDEQLAGLNRDEVAALVDTLSEQPEAVEETVEEPASQPADDPAPAEDAAVAEEPVADVAADTEGEQPEPADAEAPEPVADAESVDEVATETAQTEDEAATEGEEVTDAATSEETVSEETPEAVSVDTDGDAGVEAGAETVEAAGDAEPADTPESDAGTSDAAELTEETPVDPDAEIEAASGVDEIQAEASEPAEVAATEETETDDERLRAREVSTPEPSEFRDALPTVFELADAALAEADYTLVDAIVAEIACEVVRNCGRKRTVQSAIQAGVLLPFSVAGRLRLNTLRSVVHGYLSNFEVHSKINNVVVAAESICRNSEPEKVWQAVKEIRDYIGDPVEEDPKSTSPIPAEETPTVDTTDDAESTEEESGDA